MRRRVMMGKRELVEVVEELKSSGTWMVPAGSMLLTASSADIRI